MGTSHKKRWDVCQDKSRRYLASNTCRGGSLGAGYRSLALGNMELVRIAITESQIHTR